MARLARVVAPGVPHHVTRRGNRRLETFFSDSDNEYPAVAGLAANTALESLGAFKADTLNVSVYGENQPAAQMIFDRVGWR